MQVSQIMRQGLQSISSADTIRNAAQMMKDFDIGSISVYEESKPIGLITDRDIVISCVASGSSLDTPVSEVMTAEFVCVREEQNINEAAKLMKEHKLSQITVIDQQENPVGMITWQDISNNLRDEAIEGEILSKIKH